MTVELRILTVRQPWAWAIIHGGKDVENRVRNIAGDYRGPVAIHAGLAYDDEAPLWMLGSVCPPKESVSLVFGAIVGVVDLVDVHPARPAASGRMVDWDDHTPPGKLCSTWAAPNAYHLVLANPRPLPKPIPYRGALGLRRLDPETTAAVWAQIGGIDASRDS